MTSFIFSLTKVLFTHKINPSAGIRRQDKLKFY